MISDFAKLRKQTPGTSHCIHFNNAGAALLPASVLDVMTDYLKLEATIGGYEAFRQSSDQVSRCYEGLAHLLGASTQEIAIVDSATRAWLAAFWSISWRDGDIILTTAQEYASNYLAFLQLQKRHRIEVRVLQETSSGVVCLDDLRRQLQASVKLISLVHMPTNSGLIQPAREVGAIVREHPCLYLLDACQSAGQMPLDVSDIGCDFLTATSRKYLRGPRGVGFLYIRSKLCDALEPAWLDMRAASWSESQGYSLAPGAQRFELWEKNYAAILGFADAVALYNRIDVKAAWVRIKHLAATLRQQLSSFSSLELCERGDELSGIVSFTAKNGDHEQIFAQLQQHACNVAISPLEATRLDMSQRGLSSVIRASLHYYNSEDEVMRFCQVLRRCGYH